MGSEASLWNRLRGPLAHKDPVRVENLLGDGTPDVNYIGGWIELKHLEAFPVRPRTHVKVQFEPNQVSWLVRRGAAGGGAWCLVQVGRKYFLFGWREVPLVAKGVPKKRFEEIATWTGRNLTGIEDVL